MTSSPSDRPLSRSSEGPPLSAVLGHGDLGLSLLIIFPLFLIYEVGVAFSPSMNGVDFISHNLFALVNYSKRNYLLVHGGLALVFLAVVWVARKSRAEGKMRLGIMFLESAIYALTLGTLIIFVMQRLLGIEPKLAAGALSNVLMSIGAGVHEELVFRLGVFSGGAALLRLVGLGHRTAVGIAGVLSSALFSAAHHIGAGGEPWVFHVFVFRMLAGMLFAAIYFYRSLAHATYTHALYDVYVLVIH